jgi:putative flippase GtrA
VSARARLARFIVSGGLASLTFFVASFALLEIGWRPWAANLTAYAIGFVVGYSLQRGWTFQGRHAHGSALPRYFILQAACAGLTALAGEIGGSLLGLPPLLVAIGSTGLAGAISYLGSLLWVFPTRRT